MAFIFCAPWAGTSKCSGANWIQLAAERGAVPGAGNTFSFFSLYQKSAISTLISTGAEPSLLVASSISKGTPGLNFSRTSPGARPRDCAAAPRGQQARLTKNNSTYKEEVF